jgi:hypothetical protein
MWLEKKLKHRVNAIGRGTTDGVSLAFGIADPGASPKGLAGVGRLPSSTFAVCASQWQDPACYRGQGDFRFPVRGGTAELAMSAIFLRA